MYNGREDVKRLTYLMAIAFGFGLGGAIGIFIGVAVGLFTR